MPALAEKEVAALWREVCQRADLTTERGEPLQVIYPGIANDGRGGDFRNAVIDTGLGLLMGDIEVHTRAGGWRRHGHHTDRSYNRVILHVVMYADNTALTDNRLPVIALERYLEKSGPEAGRRENPCSNIFSQDPAVVSARLAAAGLDRFREKARRLAGEIRGAGAGQCLYRGIMGALGYTKNKIPFRLLADKVPLDLLESGRVAVRQTLLAAAGFAPVTPAIPAGITPMGLPDWELYKVRPHNAPPRRILAFSLLRERYRNTGLLEGILALVQNAPARQADARLEDGLMVGRILSGSACLLGRVRAAEISLNIILPFARAWGEISGDTVLARKAGAIYRRYHRLPPNNIERHMAEQLGINGGKITGAVCQQGLQHLYRNYCIQGRCGVCQLSSLRPGSTSISRAAVRPA